MTSVTMDQEPSAAPRAMTESQSQQLVSSRSTSSRTPALRRSKPTSYFAVLISVATSPSAGSSSAAVSPRRGPGGMAQSMTGGCIAPAQRRTLEPWQSTPATSKLTSTPAVPSFSMPLP